MSIEYAHPQQPTFIYIKDIPLLFFKSIAVIASIHEGQQYDRNNKIEQHNTRDLPEYIIPYLENIWIFGTLDHI